MVGESTFSPSTNECGKGEDCHFPNEKETVLTKFHGLGHSPEESAPLSLLQNLYSSEEVINKQVHTTTKLEQSILKFECVSAVSMLVRPIEKTKQM
jgi:hypothetical protein